MLVFPLPELVFIGSMQVVVHQPKNTELGIRNGEMEHVDGSGESSTNFTEVVLKQGHPNT